MIVAPLCSSSSANSTFIGDFEAGLLIDTGCSYKSLLRSLSLCRTDISAVKAVLVTHEHSDHVKGLYQLTKHNDIPVYASEKTAAFLLGNGLVCRPENLHDINELRAAPVNFGITAFRTPHDSVESVGFVLTSPNNYKIAYFTDLGEITDEVRENADGADFIFIEANYDAELLRRNRKYPDYVKARIASNKGHLSNADSAPYISRLVESGATRIVLAHLSRENNSPRIAFENTERELAKAGLKLDRDYTLNVAEECTSGGYIAV